MQPTLVQPSSISSFPLQHQSQSPHVSTAAPRLCLSYNCKAVSLSYLGSPLSNARHPLHNLFFPHSLAVSNAKKNRHCLALALHDVTCYYLFSTEALWGLRSFFCAVV